MNSPQNSIWGPHLWLILHVAAEQIGTNPYNRLPQEEQRIWSVLLASLRYSLPCPICKKHYIQYYMMAKIKHIDKDTIRIWLYNLHNHINMRLEKPIQITIEQLANLYSVPFNFTEHYNIVIEQMRKAIRMSLCSHKDIQTTLHVLQELKRFYGFF